MSDPLTDRLNKVLPRLVSDDFLSGQGVPVDLHDVETELTRLWGPAAERAGGPVPEQPNVTRIVLANLVVIGQTRGPGDAYSTLGPGGAVLKIGRPALVVPDGVGALRAEHVVIGWKDSREARRAMQDALPFNPARKAPPRNTSTM